jgi:hypothetical protein
VRSELCRRGLLLEADRALPSVVGLVFGEPPRRSWWGHPLGNAAYWVLQDLAHGPDLARVKLVGGKVTWVERSLWPALVAVATSGEAWQRRGLAPAARALAARVEREGELRTDCLGPWRARLRPGEAVREGASAGDREPAPRRPRGPRRARGRGRRAGRRERRAGAAALELVADRG